jgi:hypothetical protein
MAVAGAAVVALSVAAVAFAYSHKIVLFRSIGPVKLGMTRSEVHHAFRHPFKANYDPSSKLLTEHYKRGGLTVAYCCGKHGGKVGAIATISGSFATKKGINVGDGLGRLKRAYPVRCQKDNAGRVYGCKYRKPGTKRFIFFDIAPLNNKIDGIQVVNAALYRP